MKNSKKKLIIILGIVGFLFSITVVFAAFIFNQIIEGSAKTGYIDIDSKSYYIYSAENNLEQTDANYKRQSKLRKDTIAVLEGFILSSTSTYSLTGDTIFINGKSYYTKSGSTYTIAEVEVGDSIAADTYYEETKTYNGISKVGIAYDNSLNDIEVTIVGTNKLSFSLNDLAISITCQIDSEQGMVTEGEVTVSNKNYKAVINADGLGLVLIDTDITNSASGYRAVDANSAINCSASENKYANDSIYLSQLGLHFEFTTELAAYVRIHIQDGWKRTRVYASSERENYILKDQISGKSPFTIGGDNWYYDEKTNCIYLKQMFIPTQNADGTYQSQAYTFNVNEAYFYHAISTSAYTEYIDVQVSFTVDIVQANRAKDLWQFDPSTIS